MSTIEWTIYAVAVAAMANLYLLSLRNYRRARDVCRNVLDEVHDKEIQTWSKGWMAARDALVAAHPGCTDGCAICVAQAELISDLDCAASQATAENTERPEADARG